MKIKKKIRHLTGSKRMFANKTFFTVIVNGNSWSTDIKHKRKERMLLWLKIPYK